MAIEISIEMTSEPGEEDRKAAFDVVVRVAGTPKAHFEFDMFEDRNFLDQSFQEIFERMKECDPEALQALDASYNEGDQITLNRAVLSDEEKSVVLNVCSTTRGIKFD